MQKRLADLFVRLKDASTLDAAEQYARWTLPNVFTKDITASDGKRTSLVHDYQSTGALLVNSAATKIVDALFPQGSPFFRFAASADLTGIVDQLGLQGSVFSAQAEMEAVASSIVFTKGGYAAKLRAIKLLLVTGNALEYFDSETERSYVYSVRDYATKRDGAGNVLTTILRERISVADIPDDIRRAHFSNKEMYDDVRLFTGIMRERRELGYVYKVYQEVETYPVGEPSYYPEDQCPYVVLAWNLVNGEHYGRSLVEDYAGDFARLSVLSRSLTLYEVEAARVVNMVSSASGVDIDALQDAETGEFVQTNQPAGTSSGVWSHEGGNAQKIAALQAEISTIEQKLSRAFMYGGNTRQGERVTAYEIRQNAQEAQSALGDAYSTLADNWLRKLAYLYVLNKYPEIRPMFELGALELDVTVGTASLYKSAQADRLLEAVQSLQLIVPVLQQATVRTNVDALIDSVMDSFGIQSSAFFYSEEELQARQQAEQAQQQQDQQQQQSLLQVTDPTVAGQQLGLIQ